MVASEVVYSCLAVIIGYLLGSIPSAYIITRLVAGKDIRQLGGGNVGGLNVYREVGIWPALTAGIFDFCKGTAAVAIAYWLLAVPTLFVLLAGIAAVIGHNWMVFLKFSGGKGAGTTVGALSLIMPLYGYWPGLLIFFGIIVIPLIITHNVALSIGIALIFLPLVVWLGTHSGVGTIMAAILGLIMLIKFLPTARRALARSKTTRDLIFDRQGSGKKKRA